MDRSTVIWLIIAFSLILLGCMVFCSVMTRVNWDFSKLSTVRYETNKYEITTNYQNISIITDTADIIFVPSADAKTSVICHEQENAKHSVAAKDDTLAIEVTDAKKWYEHIGVFGGEPKITVSIPHGTYGTLSIQSSTGDVEIPKELTFECIAVSENTGDVSNYASATDCITIKTGTGSIRVENISAGTLDLSVSTGRVTVSNVTCAEDVTVLVSTGRANMTDVRCKNLRSRGNTGDISLTNTIAEETLSVTRSTGDIKFDRCDAAEIFVETDTGDVIGSMLTDKVFVVATDTGSVRVPKTTTGGKCEITSNTGDIKITIG